MSRPIARNPTAAGNAHGLQRKPERDMDESGGGRRGSRADTSDQRDFPKPGSARQSKSTQVKIEPKNLETRRRLFRLRTELGKIRPAPASVEGARDEILKALSRAGLAPYWTLPELSSTDSASCPDGSHRLTLIAHEIFLNPSGAFRIIDRYPPCSVYFQMAGSGGREFALPPESTPQRAGNPLRNERESRERREAFVRLLPELARIHPAPDSPQAAHQQIALALDRAGLVPAWALPPLGGADTQSEPDGSFTLRLMGHPLVLDPGGAFSIAEPPGPGSLVFQMAGSGAMESIAPPRSARAATLPVRDIDSK